MSAIAAARNWVQSPAVQRALPYAYGAAGVVGCVLAVRFVVQKIVPFPKLHLIKDIVENLLFRPASAAFCATLIARTLTPVPMGAAFAMGWTIFFTARLLMFVADKQART